MVKNFTYTSVFSPKGIIIATALLEFQKSMRKKSSCIFIYFIKYKYLINMFRWFNVSTIISLQRIRPIEQLKLQGFSALLPAACLPRAARIKWPAAIHRPIRSRFTPRTRAWRSWFVAGWYRGVRAAGCGLLISSAADDSQPISASRTRGSHPWQNSGVSRRASIQGVGIINSAICRWGIAERVGRVPVEVRRATGASGQWIWGAAASAQV